MSDLQAQVAMLSKALEDMLQAYRHTLASGKEKIEMLDGECDSVTYMIANSDEYQKAIKAVTATESTAAKKDEEISQSTILVLRKDAENLRDAVMLLSKIIAYPNSREKNIEAARNWIQKNGLSSPLRDDAAQEKV
jgi:hypothetical protein